MEFLGDIHSKVIHFPITLLILYPFFELLYLFTKKEFFSKTALLFLFLGVTGALAAVLTGNQAFLKYPDWSTESLIIFDNHELYANIVTWMFTALLFIRYYLMVKNKLNFKIHLLITIVAFAGVYFVYNTGNFGGKLHESKFIHKKQELIKSD